MNDVCGRFHFAWDMNEDAAFSISDVWMVLETIWKIPSNLVAQILQGWPVSANFFEIDCFTGQGSGGAIFSSIVWLIVIGAISSSLNEQ